MVSVKRRPHGLRGVHFVFENPTVEKKQLVVNLTKEQGIQHGLATPSGHNYKDPLIEPADDVIRV